MNSDIIEKVKNAVTNTTRKAVKLSGEAIDYTKIKLKIADLNSKLDEKYAQIGLAVYESDEDVQIDAICEEITALRQEVEELKLRLSEYKNQKTCANCGSVCDSDDDFCKSCGSRF